MITKEQMIPGVKFVSNEDKGIFTVSVPDFDEHTGEQPAAATKRFMPDTLTEI